MADSSNDKTNAPAEKRTFEEIVREIIYKNHIGFRVDDGTLNVVWIYEGRYYDSYKLAGTKPFEKLDTAIVAKWLYQEANRYRLVGRSAMKKEIFLLQTFFEELAAPQAQRNFLVNVPVLVVDPTLKRFPYDKTIEGSVYNEGKLKELFVSMVMTNSTALECRWNEKILGRIMQNYIEYQRSKRSYNVAEQIKFDKTKIEEADKFLNELYNLYKPSFISMDNDYRYSPEFFKATIRHLIWHVKNKAINGKNDYPFMLNISGSQGNGKTSFIRHLFEDILGDFFTSRKLSFTNDAFGNRAYSNYWVIYFDEMATNGDYNFDALKSLITEKSATSRTMFTQDEETVNYRSVFIGSANSPIYEIIHESDLEMRRYLNIEFTETDESKIKANTKLHRILDSEWQRHGLALWQSVDDSIPDGYMTGTALELWNAARKTYFSENNMILNWMKQDKVEIVTKGCITGLTLEEAYEQWFLEYCTKMKRNKNLPGLKYFKTTIRKMYKDKNGKDIPANKLKIAPIKKESSSVFVFGDDDEKEFIVIPEELNEYKEFKPLDLGPGIHLCDIANENVKNKKVEEDTDKEDEIEKSNEVDDFYERLVIENREEVWNEKKGKKKGPGKKKKNSYIIRPQKVEYLEFLEHSNFEMALSNQLEGFSKFLDSKKNKKQSKTPVKSRKSHSKNSKK